MQETVKAPQTATYAVSDCRESLLRAGPTCRESDKVSGVGERLTSSPGI